MDSVTIIMPVSRKEFLHRIFAQLDMMPCNAEHTNIVVLVDGAYDVFQEAQRFVTESKFAIKRCIWRGRKIKYIPGDWKIRRVRIATIHNEFKEILKDIKSTYIFSIEDDTLFPLNTLKKLLASYQAYPYAGMITGLELGRWGWTSIGVYLADDVYDTTVLNSIDPKLFKFPNLVTDLIKVDAAGLYACLIKKENYMTHDFKVWNDNIMGPDVDFGLSLRQQGLVNYADLSIRCTHLIQGGEDIKFENSKIVRVRVTKLGDNHWKHETYE